MAKRKVYRNSLGVYFKGEGLNFYMPPASGLCEGDDVQVTSVSIGQGGTGLAIFVDADGKRRSAVGEGRCD